MLLVWNQYIFSAQDFNIYYVVCVSQTLKTSQGHSLQKTKTKKTQPQSMLALYKTFKMNTMLPLDKLSCSRETPGYMEEVEIGRYFNVCL